MNNSAIVILFAVLLSLQLIVENDAVVRHDQSKIDLINQKKTAAQTGT